VATRIFSSHAGFARFPRSGANDPIGIAVQQPQEKREKDTMRITEFAAAVGSRVDSLKEDFEIRGISTLENAGEGQVSFVSSDKYMDRAGASLASAIIVPEGSAIADRTTIPMKEPWAGVLRLLNHLYPAGRERYFSGVSPTAVVHLEARVAADAVIAPGAVIGPRVEIGARTVVGPNCVIGQDCVIGDDCILHASVTLAHETRLGNRVQVHPGTVLGADGFKYEAIGGRLTKIPQVGRVVIEDDVEIGANVCIDRASFTETRVGRGAKVDNLVQLAHNVTVGANCIIVSQCGIAGSTTIGDGTILAASVGVADNLKIGSGVTVLARSGVKDDIADGQVMLGAPARPVRQAARIYAAEARLPDLVAEVNKLRAKVEQLEKRLADG
jgi:UDP-3-O-[3-hydroxymyristoyl] glucosamine N-acyltransferase